MLPITYIFRKRTPTAFSIEKLFDRLYEYFEDAGVSVQRLELPHVSTGLVSVMRNAWFVAKRRIPDILHVTGDVHYAAVLRPLSKTIITIHDCVVLQRGTGFKRLVLRILWFSLPLRLAHAIVVISDQTKQELMSVCRVPETKINVIPNFVDPRITYVERKFAIDEPRVLHVGTTRNKNLLRVITALQGIRCRLMIVGPLSAEAIEVLHARQVNYENFVGLDDCSLMDLYRQADIVSFPSTYEGFGMPILEGQAVGRAVLTSDRAPMREVAGEGGAILVDPESIESIRNGFLTIINDQALRARLIITGLQNSRRFSLEAVAEQYCQLYRTLAAV